jgi:pilus assembly protein CpaE
MLQSLKISDLDITRQEAPAPAPAPAADAFAANGLSVALIAPDEGRRYAILAAITGAPCRLAQQLSHYPALDQLPALLKHEYDIILLDLDCYPEQALDLVENICATSQGTMMVYSARQDSEMMLRCMRAGAREFLTFPVSPASLAEAVVRAAARRPSGRQAPKTDGRLCVFCGVKGGAGVTTVATNFAVSAAKESATRVLLLDLDLPLGDTALQLGLSPQYSTVDALQNHARLDTNLLSRLVTQHSSGVYLLGAPGNWVRYDSSSDAVNKLIQVARQEFDTVVVDAGSRFQYLGTGLFAQEATVFLVSHVGISELRNSNRILSELFPANLPKVEIILNRHSSSALGVDEEHITKALTRPAKWRVPEDKATVREMQNTATPLALGESQVARVIRQMARTACGLTGEPEKKKKLMGLF